MKSKKGKRQRRHAGAVLAPPNENSPAIGSPSPAGDEALDKALKELSKTGIDYWQKLEKLLEKSRVYWEKYEHLRKKNTNNP